MEDARNMAQERQQQEQWKQHRLGHQREQREQQEQRGQQAQHEQPLEHEGEHEHLQDPGLHQAQEQGLMLQAQNELLHQQQGQHQQEQQQKQQQPGQQPGQQQGQVQGRSVSIALGVLSQEGTWAANAHAGGQQQQQQQQADQHSHPAQPHQDQQGVNPLPPSLSLVVLEQMVYSGGCQSNGGERSRKSGAGGGLLAMPDEVLIAILRRVSLAKGNLPFLVTCSRFAALAPEATASVQVKTGRLLPEQTLLASLRALQQGVSSLSLSRDSLDRISDSLLSLLSSPAHRTSLTRLHLVFTRDCSASPARLVALLRACSSLRTLTLEGWCRGCMPDVLHGLSHLHTLSLELPCNVLPDSVGHLPRLRTLKVTRRYGRNVKIPETMTRLRQLQELSLDCWDLSGAQDSISTLTTLTTLHLALRFPYQLPWSLEGLLHLRRLTLSCRYLEVLPDGLPSLHSLETLREAA